MEKRYGLDSSCSPLTELVDSNCFPRVFSSAGVDEDLLSLTSLIEGDVDAVDSNEESGDLPNLGEDTEEPELLAISNSEDTKSEGKTQNTQVAYAGAVIPSNGSVTAYS